MIGLFAAVHESVSGPLRQILQRKRMSAFGGRAAVTQTPHDVAVDPTQLRRWVRDFDAAQHGQRAAIPAM
jgi:hypothetical protein